MLEPDKTEQIQRLMTANEVLNSPGGKFAIDNYKKLQLALQLASSSPSPIRRGTYSSADSNIAKKITILRALHFDPHLDSYTVSFYKFGETKRTEQMMKTAEILDLPGGPEAIDNYKQLYNKILPTELRPSRVLSVFDFNSVLDNYKVNIKETGEQKKIQKTMTVFDILNLQDGAKAIANYKRLHSPTTPRIFGLFNFNVALDNYTVNMLHPGETERVEKLMTSAEIRKLPGGYKAISDYKKLHDLTHEQPNATLKNLCILRFNKDQDNYTVKFSEAGKRGKCEKMFTELELLNLQGKHLYVYTFYFCLYVFLVECQRVLI
jgi:hypothetical protein